MTGVASITRGRAMSSGSSTSSGTGGTSISRVAGVARLATLASAPCPAGATGVASRTSWARGTSRSSGTRAAGCSSVAGVGHHSCLTGTTLNPLGAFWAFWALRTGVAPRTSVTSRAVSSGASYAIITCLSGETLRASNTIATGGARCAIKTHISLVSARTTRTSGPRSSSSAV